MRPLLIFPAVVLSAQVPSEPADASQPHVARGDTEIVCTSNHLASVEGVQAIIDDLAAVGSTMIIDSGDCTRLGCKNHTAVWWCNTQGDSFERSSTDLSDDLTKVLNLCELPDGEIGGTNTNMGVCFLSIIGATCKGE